MENLETYDKRKLCESHNWKKTLIASNFAFFFDALIWFDDTFHHLQLWLSMWHLHFLLLIRWCIFLVIDPLLYFCYAWDKILILVLLICHFHAYATSTFIDCLMSKSWSIFINKKNKILDLITINNTTREELEEEYLSYSNNLEQNQQLWVRSLSSYTLPIWLWNCYGIAQGG